MKCLVFVWLLLLVGLTAGAQNVTIERLRNKLAAEKSDTGRCKILDSLSMYNMFFNNQSDSTLRYCNEYIKTALRIPDKKYLILAYARAGFYYNNVGQYSVSLNMTLKGLDLAESEHIQDYLSALYYDQCWFYLNSDNTKAALASGLKGIHFLKFGKDPFFDQALHLYGITGSAYLDLNKEDSALFYYRQMDSISNRSTEQAAKSITYFYWVRYYLYYKKDYPKTDSVSLKAIAECRKYGDFLLNFFYLFSSSSFLRQGETEKAIADARAAYALSKPITDTAAQDFAATLLSAAYEKSGNLDSAYHYLKIEDRLNNSISAHINANEVQQAQFDLQMNRKEQENERVLQRQKDRSRLLIYVFLTVGVFILSFAIFQLRNNRQRKRANAVLQQEKQKVETTLSELKATQAQLIQSEKMASLGELTAGIAHEIQNPLNFINNFSDVNAELSDELDAEADKGNIQGVKIIAKDIKENSEKINRHGKRADSIVKGMLQHSRTSTGQKEPVDINALADEYLRLSYHGLRAKNSSFNATMKTDYDGAIGIIPVIPQETGRVLLNLYNNAFYAVNEKKRQQPEGYEPTVSVSTRRAGDQVEIRVKDNGNGIPQHVIDKIFQPFFTTKPAGQGTGLGLSLSYDAMKAQGGELKVISKEGEGAEFVVIIPVS